MTATRADVVPREVFREAIRAADARTINGLPDGHTVAAECSLDASTITNRFHDLAERGEARLHRSTVADPGHAGEVLTVELLEADDGG